MYLTIYDYEYVDTGRLVLAINLKMSSYNQTESSFTVKANHGDEYFAYGTMIDSPLLQTPQLYFDLIFKLTFTDINTGLPLDLNAFKQGSENISFSLISSDLNVDIVGTMQNRPPQ